MIVSPSTDPETMEDSPRKDNLNVNGRGKESVPEDSIWSEYQALLVLAEDDVSTACATVVDSSSALSTEVSSVSEVDFTRRIIDDTLVSPCEVESSQSKTNQEEEKEIGQIHALPPASFTLISKASVARPAPIIESDDDDDWITIEEAIRNIMTEGSSSRKRSWKQMTETKTMQPVMWEQMFGLLTKYRIREGNIDVPEDHMEEGQTLGSWLSTERRKYGAGEMDHTKRRRLESLGMVWDLRWFKWEKMFGLLKNYVDRKKSFYMHSSHKEKGESLAVWLRTQRIMYQNGKLDKRKLTMLESLGKDWHINRSTIEVSQADMKDSTSTKDSFVEDTAIKEDTSIPENASASKEETAIEEEDAEEFTYRKQLVKVIWKAETYDEYWQRTFDQYIEWTKNANEAKKKDIQPPKQSAPLRLWVKWQRRRYKSGKLSEERIKRLNGIGFGWAIRHEQFMSMFEQAKAYKNKHGTVEFPFRFNKWAASQHSQHAKGTLHPQHKDLLDSIGFFDDRKEDHKEFMETFKKLKSTKTKSCFQASNTLRPWVFLQHRKFIEGRLEKDRMDMLHSIDFWNADDFKFRKMLQRFCANSPDAGVGRWVKKQRMLYNLGYLSSARVEVLNSVGFEWNEKK